MNNEWVLMFENEILFPMKGEMAGGFRVIKKSQNLVADEIQRIQFELLLSDPRD